MMKYPRAKGGSIRYSKPTARRCLVAALVMLVCLMTLSTPASAQVTIEPVISQPSENKTVTVAYFQYGNYMSLDENGKPLGFAIDYLNEIAKYTNWEYEYLLCRSGAEALEAVKTGKADIVPAIYHTDERESQVSFSKMTLCQTNTTLYVSPSDTRFAYEDFENFDGMKVGALAGSHDAEIFEAYREEHGFDAELVLYPAFADLTIALENGVVDTAAIVYLGENIDYRIVAQFEPEPMYFVFPNDKHDILNAFNEAMSGTALQDPEYSAKLYRKYFGVNTNQDPMFTRDEYELMETAPVISVVYDSSRAPLSYTDPRTGKFSGAVSSLFESIEKTTGFRFKYIPVDNYTEGTRMVERGEADIIYTIDANTEGSTLSMTPVYLNDPMVKVSGPTESETTIAFPESYWHNNNFIHDRKDKAFITFTTPQECLDAVLHGEVDVAYLDLNVAIYQLSNSKYKPLRINTLTNYTNEMCIGISSHTDPRVANILSRCVQYTSTHEMSRWISESSLANTPMSFTDIVQKHPIESIAIITTLAFAAILVILYIARTKIKNNRQINKIIYTDVLTGGWNLYRFQIEVSSILKEDKQTDYAILYFDFSRFKSFNAVFGFAEGDRLLIDSSRLLAGFISEKERYARVTADEFVALVQWRGWEWFLERFHELDRQINDLDVVKGHAYKTLIIGGVYLIEPSQTDSKASSISDMIDCARYARESIAGQAPRSTVALYSSEMKERDIAERHLLNEAETALKNGEFVAYYQPKVEISTGRIVGHEALARWASPKNGILQPGTFIPLFEQNGFIVELDLHIFELACKRVRDSLDRGLTVVPISCNFSRLHLRKNDLPEKLKSLVDYHNVPAKHFELELTENLVIEDFERALEICNRLKALGFPVSIDDFGSGYSSLGTLQSLPIDVLKLDKSFLINGDLGNRNQGVLEGIIQIAHNLKIKVVMEGVETKAQADMLTSFDNSGPDEIGIIAQGYLYSPPVDLESSEQQMRIGYLEPSG